MPEKLPPRNIGGNVEHTLAHHDASITNLASRTTRLETAISSLQTEVHQGFSGITERFHGLENTLGARIDGSIGVLSARLEKFDARPTFNLHKSVQTVVHLAILFSMVVGGIIWVTAMQFAPLSSTVTDNKESIDRITKGIDAIEQKLGWLARIEPDPAKR